MTLAAVLALLAGCGGSEREASSSVHVESISDCSELQVLLGKAIEAAGALKDAGAEYDQELASIDAITARIEEVGCNDADRLELRATYPDVYAEVGAMTDCSTLQGVFDTAVDRGANSDDVAVLDEQRAYMNAANARMAELGCHG